MGLRIFIFTSDVHKIKVNGPSLIKFCIVVLIYSVKNNSLAIFPGRRLTWDVESGSRKANFFVDLATFFCDFTP